MFLRPDSKKIKSFKIIVYGNYTVFVTINRYRFRYKIPFVPKTV